MDEERMIKAARVIKTGCNSLEYEDCYKKEVGCPFQEKQLRPDKYVCILKSFDKYPCDWELPITLDEWISRLDNGDADKLSRFEQIEIKEMLIELKIRREKESNE